MKTEKRAAKVGERIIATVDDTCFDDYEKGDEGTVIKIGVDPGTVHVITDKRGQFKSVAILFIDEYEVIINE